MPDTSCTLKFRANADCMSVGVGYIVCSQESNRIVKCKHS